MTVALTTVDNPNDPINEIDKWYVFDMVHNYNTCGVLARAADVKPTDSYVEANTKVEAAIDRIIAADPFGLFKKVVVND